MQNTSASTAQLGGSHQWQTPGLPNVYQSTPRSASNPTNPRSFSGPETIPDQRRNEQYDQSNYYPQGGYSNPYNAGFNVNPLHDTASPSQPRRTSHSKPASTPPTSAPPGANPSPNSYYPPRQDSGGVIPQSYPQSAPPAPHMSGQQPQTATAHPYSSGGGYYNNYYEPSNQQWSSQYHQMPRPNQQSTPTISNTEHRTPQTSGTAGYDYQSSPYGSGGWNENRWQTPGGRQGSNQWGYQGVAPMPQQGQYPWQHQQWQQQSYYPQGGIPPTATAVPLPPTPSSGKKEKKKKEDDYSGLGKRSSEPDEPKESGKGKKKGKKEEAPPKQPMKSHLHPPRQAQSAWQLFFTDELNKAKEAASQGHSPGGTPQHAKLNVAQIAKDAGTAYANLSEEQKVYYAGKVQESKEQYARELAVWQATLTPDDIRAENAFRAQQRKEGKSRKGNLKDPNAPKKPLSAYFLFLKDIRENDALRMKVWGDESETTKQSVLAAERWRSLSDDEKRPFLAQAEKDKQDYEALRKVYEDEAAARARGEDVPARPIIIPEVTPVKFEPGKSHKKKAASPKASSPKTSSENPQPSSDDFSGFHNPLEDMDLGGFQDVASTTKESNEEWGDVKQIIGEEKTGEAVETAKEEDVDPDTSVAPALDEAVAETAKEDDMPVDAAPAATETEVQQVAAAAEGDVAVPAISPKEEEPAAASAIPTEEVSEMPVDPPMEEEVPSEPVATIQGAPVAMEDDEEPLAAPKTDPTMSGDTEVAEQAFDSAALSGEVVPEAIDDTSAPISALEPAPEPEAEAAPDAPVVPEVPSATEAITEPVAEPITETLPVSADITEPAEAPNPDAARVGEITAAPATDTIPEPTETVSVEKSNEEAVVDGV